jgi:hypothetical protein
MTLAATLGLAALAGTADAHEGDILIYRSAAGELYMNYPWSTPTFLDEVLAPYRGDALRINISRRIIPSIPLDQYPPFEGSQIYLEVVDAVPHAYFRDGANPARIIAGAEHFFCGTGGGLWDKTVWVHADQFHPEWPWAGPEWYVDIRAYDAAGLHVPSPVYRFKLGLENFCPADLTNTATPGTSGYLEPNQVVDNEDFFAFLTLFAEGHWRADGTTGAVPGQPGYGEPNGLLTNDDFFFYLTRFIEGCHF